MASCSSCPVDRSSSTSCSSDSLPTEKASSEKCPVDHSQFTKQQQQHLSSSDLDKCPVDHKARSTWTGLFSSPSSNTNSLTAASTSATETSLPTAREVSSIPRADVQDEKWVYPSEAQFFAAMARKQHNPRASDMRVIVPIHNAVNERAWGEVLGWEGGRGGERCGGIKLVSFKGRPNERTPRAWIKTLLGWVFLCFQGCCSFELTEYWCLADRYQAPFDRHDWVVDRCGTRIRYVIDFYTGKSSSSRNVSFYLDVRPALDSWEAVKMRTSRFFDRWISDALSRTNVAKADSGGAGARPDKTE